MESIMFGYRRGCFLRFFSAAVYHPARRGAWRLRTEPFDYRNAQHSGALLLRGGEWYSRSWASLAGDLELCCPTSDPDLPNPITAHARISWWPARATFTWLDGGMGFQKLSARPLENSPSEWITVPYDDTVFSQDIRHRFPRAFLTEPIHCPPKPTETTAPNSDTAKSTPPITVTEENPRK